MAPENLVEELFVVAARVRGSGRIEAGANLGRERSLRGLRRDDPAASRTIPTAARLAAALGVRRRAVGGVVVGVMGVAGL